MYHDIRLICVFAFIELLLMIRFSCLAFPGSVRFVRYSPGTLSNNVAKHFLASSARMSTNSHANIPPSDLLQISLPTNENNPELLKIRHTTAHVMAMAVQRIYPDIKVTIGPWIENG